MGPLTFICKVAVGMGALNIYSGIIDSPRYEGAEIKIEFDAGTIWDIKVKGPIDQSNSYRERGGKLSAEEIDDIWVVEAKFSDTQTERIIIDRYGKLLWVQSAWVQKLNVGAVSLYQGKCYVQ